jgi:two-component system chemotaxis response regulator CheB
MRPARVLVVDDSAVVRGLLARGLAQQGLEVVGVAADPFIARDLIFSRSPDVLTLDIEMPRMNGLTFLERLMAFRPLPVVVLSSLSLESRGIVMRALELGAVEVLAKPAHNLAAGPKSEAMAELARIVSAASQAKVRSRWAAALKARVGAHRPGSSTPAKRIIALAASTGGTQALSELLGGLPLGDMEAGCLIVQHMPGDFTASFAQRLNEAGLWQVREARHGDHLRAGEALLAPGGRHMAIVRDGDRWRVLLQDGAPVNFSRPSADVLFNSVARQAGAMAVGAILTGMGRDGAAGLLAMRQAGAPTLAQDESSSVVWGMPGEAVRMGAAMETVALDALPRRIEAALRRGAR